MLQMLIPATLRIKGGEVERGVFYYGDIASALWNSNCKDALMRYREIRQRRKSNKKIRPKLVEVKIIARMMQFKNGIGTGFPANVYQDSFASCYLTEIQDKILRRKAHIVLHYAKARPGSRLIRPRLVSNSVNNHSHCIA